jgi:hypothetical protein
MLIETKETLEYASSKRLKRLLNPNTCFVNVPAI